MRVGAELQSFGELYCIDCLHVFFTFWAQNGETHAFAVDALVFLYPVWPHH